jgi:hypothetical protein
VPGAGAGAAGAEDDDPSVDDEPLEELLLPSVWAHAAAPLPTIMPANAAAAMACLNCTCFVHLLLSSHATVTDEPGIAL